VSVSLVNGTCGVREHGVLQAVAARPQRRQGQKKGLGVNSEDVQTANGSEDDSWRALQHDLELMIERSGLNRSELARAAGCSPSTLRRWLKQPRPLPWPKTEALILACLTASGPDIPPAVSGELAWWRERHTATTAQHTNKTQTQATDAQARLCPMRGLWSPGMIPLYCATLTLLLMAGVTLHFGLEVRTRRHPPVATPHDPRWLLSATNRTPARRSVPQTSRDATRFPIAPHEQAGEAASDGSSTLLASCGKSVHLPGEEGALYSVTCRVVSLRTGRESGTALVIWVRPVPEVMVGRARLVVFALSGAGECP
jgi:lambda repressor-like predicted transcriptional regulator